MGYGRCSWVNFDDRIFPETLGGDAPGTDADEGSEVEGGWGDWVDADWVPRVGADEDDLRPSAPKQPFCSCLVLSLVVDRL